MGQLKARLDGERADAERRLRDQLELLTRRNDELERSSKALLEQKYQLDTKVSELSSRLGSAEGELRTLREEVGPSVPLLPPSPASLFRLPLPSRQAALP